AKKIMFPRLSLPVVASLTPPDFTVKILDEYFDSIDYDQHVDLIGITAMTTQAPRAYQISDEFRKRGKKVIMGGSHATALPEEALNHVDSVVIGEAEGIWNEVLQEFTNHRLRKIYRSSEFPSLKGLPIPRYDLLKQDRYRLLKINFPVQIGRGCPNRCEFCSVNQFFGHRYRHRPIEEIVEEIKRIDRKGIVFVDDNLMGDPEFAKSLFEHLIPLKIRWVGQVSLNVAKDEELLDLAVRSGGALMFIGLETLSPKTIQDMHKTFFHPGEMAELLRKIRSRGIHIRASVIFGFDGDDKEDLEAMVQFLRRRNFILFPAS
ncbi:MAG: radical SAM protein, partial [Deltaproteobacteria bacterium]|nr:radical SAM protein [Deltaproteobacteria bacterium]